MKLLAQLQTRWRTLATREQRLLQAAVLLVAGALLWWLALAPALAVLKRAPAQHVALDAQLQQMQQLKAQAQALQAKPVLPADQLRQLIEASLKPLGSAAQMSQQAERITISVKGLDAQTLAQWLVTLRENARIAPSELHLLHNTSQSWDGSLVITLGARP